MTRQELARSAWFPFSDEPVRKRLWYLPRLESPSVLAPASSPDGRWHLFCQSWIGIQHFVSTNGIAWHIEARLPMRGASPAIIHEGARWYLFTCREGRLLCVHESKDLRHWSGGRTVLEGGKDQVIGHPRPCRMKGMWRLYHTVGELELEGGRNIPLSIGMAVSPLVDGPYRDERQVITADADDPATNMGIGSFGVLALNDGIVLFATSAHWVRTTGRSTSALVCFLSQDGIHFGEPKTILSLPEGGWASGAFLDCCLLDKPEERTWYCYYAARSQGSFPTSSIGLLLGRDVQTPSLLGQTT